MSEISLRDYLAKLDNLLNANSADEVIQHCRHILQYFPKNVSAYRYLGRALVENGRWEEATSALQRVLSVVPDDFVAHVGLSEAMERTNHPEDAIWHLERAFEQHPADKNILEQLRLLYSQHHGVENAKIPLTAVAVARQALKTQSYVQAADTLRGALSRSAQRVDLRLLLAEVLWEAEFRLESAELAMDVLEKLPDCLSANRIMAGLWLTEGRPTDAQRYINHLESVDPYLAVELVTGQPVEDNAFRLEELDFRSAAKSAVVAEDNPDWLAGITTPASSGPATRTTEFEALSPEPPADDQWDQWVSAMLQGTPKPADKPAPPTRREWPEAEKPVLDSGELNPFHLNSTGELDEIDTIFQTGTFGEDSGFETDDPVAWLRERGLEIEENAEVVSPGAALLSDTDDEFVMPEPNDPTAWMGRYNLEMSDDPDTLFGDDESLTSIGSPDLTPADDSLDWLSAAAPPAQSPEDDSSPLLDWSDDAPVEVPTVTNPIDEAAETSRPRRGLTAMFNDASFDWNLPPAAEDEAEDEWSAQFDDKKKASAVTTTNPDWLSGLDDAGFGLDMPDTGTLTWGKEVPQSGGDEMPDNTSGFNADANDNDDAFSWMDDMDAESSSDDQPVSADVPDWLSELKPADDADASSDADASEENDLGWMSSISGSDDDEEAASGGIEEEFAWMDETADEPVATPTDSPDWLAAAAPAAPATSTDEDAFDWMNGIDFGNEAAKSTEPVPDWLNEPETGMEIETPADVHAPSLFDAAPAADETSWMSEFGDFAAPANPDADFPVEDAVEATPDWLSDLEAAAPPAAAVSSVDDDTSWMSDFGDLRQEVEAEFTPPVPVAETSPNWLSEFEPETDAEPTGEAADDFGLDFEDAAVVQETPDWLSEIKPKTAPVTDDLSWMDAMAEASASSSAPAAESTPDWLSELEPQAEADDEDEFPVADPSLTETPDWLSALEPQAETDAEADDELAVETDVVAETPDWLSALEPQAETDAEADDELAAETDTVAETPDWLSEFAPVPETPAESVSAADDLSWMEAFSDDPVAEEAQAEPAAELSPDWLSELEPEVPAVAAEAAPDWLSELEPETEPATESAITSEDADWLSELNLEAAAEASAQAAVEATPDWLSELEPETEAAAQSTAASAPDWLTELEPETWPEPQAEPVAETEADWLTELDLEPAAEAEAEVEAVSEGTPDWLSALNPGADSELEAELEAQPADEADVDWLPELNTPSTTEFDAFNMPLSEVDAMSTPTSTPNAEIDWISELEPELSAEDEATAVHVPTEELASLFDPESEAEALPDAPETALTADVDTFDADILPYTADDAVIAATPEEEFAAAAVPAEDVIPVLDAEAVPSAVTEPDVITEHSFADAESDNTPDWLNAMVPGLDVDYAPTETVEEEIHEVEEASPREFAWLNNMVDEELAEAASTFTFSKTPAWLDRLVPPAQPAAPQPDEDFPDWVSDDDEADLPEWLR